MSEEELDNVPDMPITRRFLRQDEWQRMPRMALSDMAHTLRPTRKYGPKPNESQLAEMLAMMEVEGGVTKAAMAVRLCLTVKAIEYRLEKLKSSGLCRASGLGTNVRWLRVGGEVVSYIHINRPKFEHHCSVIDCPTCERPRRMLVSTAEWYGSTITCAGCGDQWADGERMDRPLMRGWRRVSIENARRHLAAIGVPA